MNARGLSPNAFSQKIIYPHRYFLIHQGRASIIGPGRWTAPSHFARVVRISPIMSTHTIQSHSWYHQPVPPMGANESKLFGGPDFMCIWASTGAERMMMTNLELALVTLLYTTVQNYYYC